ncbi:MAG: folylpolyglutamate synthase/dihydrofolate synthase family protein [Bacteroidales bacterium]|nr:folylpolyglutamate synthase/dihydrofolate synthase family protein [Bacteroidales bacterium]
MNYKETLDYLYNSLPMYHRIGQAAYKADITNTVELMRMLGNPERKFRSIHVAGTNGKGSVSHFLASILHKAGYKVGLYTSPHLRDFRERIRINGAMIPEENVTRFVSLNKNFMEGLQLSFFEMTVGLAFDYFANEGVDVAVVEVGMGGRLDSTNVITPLLSVITNIGLDHTQFLGDTRAKIAGEKAGIIKRRVPVVIGETHPETEDVFLRKAEEMEAPICFADQHYEIREASDATATEEASLHFDVYCDGERIYRNLFSPMGGWYQKNNLATVFQVIQELPQVGLKANDEDIMEGIADVIRGTGLHGRWEKVAEKPLTICETAHNEDGMRSMLRKLNEMRGGYETLRMVYGCVNDKDYRHIVNLLPANAVYYVTRPSVPRALDEQTLFEAVKEAGMKADVFPTAEEAIIKARAEARENDLVLVTGSIFLVADALAYFKEE